MNLEDHLGNVIRKARRNAHVSSAAAAQAARITKDQLELIEEGGQCPSTTDFASLGHRLDLDGSRLAALAAGWRPAPRNLEAWGGLRQFSTTEEGNTVNCFLAWDEASSQAALFDTGWLETPVVQFIREQSLTLRHLFITHAHHDHVAARDPLLSQFPSLEVHGGASLSGEAWNVGRLHVEARAVPGHADDGMIYVITGWAGQAAPVAVVGDTIFAGSVARGFVSTPVLMDGIRQQILTLPPATLLCPGHGPVTTVAEEVAHNPFF